MAEEQDRIVETVDSDGNSIELYILPPSFEVSRLCDIEAKKAWTFALENDVKTYRFLQDMFEKKGIWTKEHEDELNTINAEIAIKAIMIEKLKSTKPEKCVEVAKEISEKRSRAFMLSEIKNEAFMHSCEGIAADIRMESYIAYATVYNNDRDKRYFKNYEDFKKRRNDRASIDVWAAYYRIVLDETVDLSDDLPEKKFLEEFYKESSLIKQKKQKKSPKKKTKKKKKKRN